MLDISKIYNSNNLGDFRITKYINSNSVEIEFINTTYKNTVRAVNTRNAKQYVFTSPFGDVVDIYNMTEFCRENKLNQSAMSKVSNGARNHHKGWTYDRELTSML